MDDIAIHHEEAYTMGNNFASYCHILFLLGVDSMAALLLDIHLYTVRCVEYKLILGMVSGYHGRNSAGENESHVVMYSIKAERK